MATRFDTLRTYTAIKAAGVDEPAAQAITTAIQDSILDVRDQLATKADVQGLKVEIDGLHASTKADIDNLRATFTGSLDTKVAELGKQIADSKFDTLRTFWIAVAIIIALGSGVNGLVTYFITHSIVVTAK